MLRSLQTLSATCFYLLGLGAFLSYLLMKNEIGNAWTTVLLQSIDLPLLLAGLTYGGISLYRSLATDEEPSKALMLTLGIPLLAVFLFFFALNFFVTNTVAPS